MTMNMLRAEGLHLAYGGLNVITDLTLSLPYGKVTAILGPNGCGKSTLLRAFARLIKPQAGRVTLAGSDLHQINNRALSRRLAILPQSSIAPEGIGVADLVSRGRAPWRGMLSGWIEADHKAVQAALLAVGLQDQAHRRVDELSGGQRQRVWLALILAQETEILLLDEPTTWLDLPHQIEVLQLLRQLNRDRGLTVVSVLHDLNLAARYSDHLVMMGPGGVICEGTPRAVLTPDHLLAAFGLKARVLPDPVTNTPMVVPL